MKGGINLYEYAAGNPIRLVDRNGTWPWDPTPAVAQTGVAKRAAEVSAAATQPDSPKVEPSAEEAPPQPAPAPAPKLTPNQQAHARKVAFVEKVYDDIKDVAVEKGVPPWKVPFLVAQAAEETKFGEGPNAATMRAIRTKSPSPPIDMAVWRWAS